MAFKRILYGTGRRLFKLFRPPWGLKVGVEAVVSSLENSGFVIGCRGCWVGAKFSGLTNSEVGTMGTAS